MNRPRMRVDAAPLWPAFAGLVFGSTLFAAAFRFARMVDDAQELEADEAHRARWGD